MASSSQESSGTGTPGRIDLPTRILLANYQLENIKSLLDARITHSISDDSNGTNHFITIRYIVPNRTE